MLYYIDRSYAPILDIFKPKVPSAIMNGEDHEIPRICLCKTIEGCINAASWGHSNIQYRKLKEVFRIYIFDENDITKQNIISSDELWEKQLVPDAYITGEVWVINQTLKPKDIKYFQIGEFFDTQYEEILTKEQFLAIEKDNSLCFEDVYTWEIIKDIEIIWKEEQNLLFTHIIEIPKNNIKNDIESNGFYLLNEFLSKENSILDTYENEGMICFKLKYSQAIDNEVLICLMDSNNIEYFNEENVS